MTQSTHPYGPSPHHQWQQSPKGLSLVRRPPPPAPVWLDTRDEAVEIDLRRSALVVVDMQNDFCHPKGWFGQKGIDVSPMREPIATIHSLLAPWRAAGGRVVWLHWGIRADLANLSPTILYKGKRQPNAVGYGETSPEDRGASLVPGDWGAARIEELPDAPGDLLVYKHRLSGFCDNELDGVLRQQGITTLLFAGVNTDRCVFASLQDAAFLGYDCLLVADACGSPSPGYVSDAIHFLVRQLHGFVTDSQALLRATAPPAP